MHLLLPLSIGLVGVVLEKQVELVAHLQVTHTATRVTRQNKGGTNTVGCRLLIVRGRKVTQMENSLRAGGGRESCRAGTAMARMGTWPCGYTCAGSEGKGSASHRLPRLFCSRRAAGLQLLGWPAPPPVYPLLPSCYPGHPPTHPPRGDPLA